MEGLKASKLQLKAQFGQERILFSQGGSDFPRYSRNRCHDFSGLAGRCGLARAGQRRKPLNSVIKMKLPLTQHTSLH